MSVRLFAMLLLLAAGLLATSAAFGPVDWAPTPARNSPPAEVGIENLRVVSPRVLSGSQPQSPSDYAYLARRDVKVVVSVDGVPPAAEWGEQHGIRGVHIPLGYDGVPPAACEALTRVMRETPTGRVFVHCHHGKHRGPAAAAIAARAGGWGDAAAARAFLQKAGTDARYAGLWRDVAEFKPLPLDAELPELQAAVEVDRLTSTMAALGRQLQVLSAANLAEESQAVVSGGSAPTATPAHAALMAWQALKEADRAAGDFDEDFRLQMRAAAEEARGLEKALRRGDRASAAQRFAALRARCSRCHAAYRD